MTNYSWKSAVSGDWSTAADWLPTGSPDAATATAQIEATGTYTVTIASSEEDTVNAVTLGAGTLDVLGTLALAGTAPILTVKGGTLEVAGTVAGGTVRLGGGTLVLNSGATLDGVKFQGSLAVANSIALYVLGGLTVQTATGGSPGSIGLSAGSASIRVEDTETLNSATLAFGSGSGDTLYNYDLLGTGTTLTLGSGFAITQSGGQNDLENAGHAGDTIVDNGKVTVTGGDLLVQNGSFDNGGSIAISGGGIVDLSATVFDNTGSISVGSGSELVLGRNANAGQITVASGGTLDLNGGTLAGSGITDSGILLIGGYGDLGGGTLVVGTGGYGSVQVGGSGTLADGTVALAGGVFTLAKGATLDDLTVEGPLAVANNSTLFVLGGLRVQTASGGAPGSIDLSAGFASLDVKDSETFNNGTLNFGSGNGDLLYEYDLMGTSTTLTLGSAFTVTQSGGDNVLQAGGNEIPGGSYTFGDTIANDGTIDVTGGDLMIQDGTFINAGSIAISGGGILDLSDYTFVRNTGSIHVGLDSTLVLSSYTDAGHITVDSGGQLELTGDSYFGGGITDNGFLLIADGATQLLGGTLVVGPSGYGNVEVAADAILVGGTVALAGGILTLDSGAILDNVTVQGVLRVAEDNQLSISGSLVVESASGLLPGTIDLSAGDASLYINYDETLDNATLRFGNGRYDDLGNFAFLSPDSGPTGTLTLGSGFTVTQSGGLNQIYNAQSNFLIVSDGTIAVTGGDLQVQEGGFTNAGSIAVSGGTVDLSLTSLTNTGSITIGSGGTVLLGTASGTGSIVIGTGGNLDVLDATGAAATFGAAGGTLTLADAGGYSGTIFGFAAGDTIDLPNVTFSSSGTATLLSGNTLQVIEGSTTIDLRLDPSAHYTGEYFHVAPAGTAVTVNDQPLCFLSGTLIRTPGGEVAVEHLAVGDLVCSASGAERAVMWVGKGQVLVRRGRRSAATPVIVRKGALAPNVPFQDLRVTRAHALFLDGVLIPVEFLVNHRSILWDDHSQDVALYHIELETHDVLVANGAPAESYRDDGNRWLFQNANSAWGLTARAPCAPVVTGGDVVDAAWRRLLERSGWRTTTPLTDDPDLHLVVDGVRVDAKCRTGEFVVFALGGTPGSVRIASRAGSPQELGLTRDPRCLGVGLRRVIIRQGARSRLIGANDPSLTDGFHGFEADNALRWTDGDAGLPTALFDEFRGSLEVVLHCCGGARYVEDGEVRRAA